MEAALRTRGHEREAVELTMSESRFRKVPRGPAVVVPELPARLKRVGGSLGLGLPAIAGPIDPSRSLPQRDTVLAWAA